MAKIYLMGMCLLLLCQCRNGSETDTAQAQQETDLPTSGLPKKIELNTGARQLVREWPQFLDLENSLDGLYRTMNREDLRLFLDEILEKEKLLAASDYPELFDSPQVIGRQKVFKTYLLKAKAQIEYREEPMTALGQMMDAYNALCEQLNLMVHGKLDHELLSDEN